MQIAKQMPIQTTKAIGYARVSTALQGKEGYSLEAQEEAIKKYCTEQGIELLDVYTEVESGRRNNREVVNKVLNLCKLKSAKLIISRLDRLTRDLHFLTSLQKSKLDFTALDNPSADTLVIQILTSIAENESVNISRRTKFALDLAKSKGVELGNYKNLVALYHRLHRDYPKEFEVYANLRREHHKYLTEHKRFNEFCKVVDPVYERVETPFGWDEWIKKPNQWGYKQTFEDEYEYWEWVNMKLKQVIPNDPWVKMLDEGLSFNLSHFNHILKNRFCLWWQVGSGTTWSLGLIPNLDVKPATKRKGNLDIVQEGGVDLHRYFAENEFHRELREKIGKAWNGVARKNTSTATKARVDKAKEEALDYLPHVREARAKGITGVRPLGRYLDDLGIPTKTGKKWSDNPRSISQLLGFLEGQDGV